MHFTRSCVLFVQTKKQKLASKLLKSPSFALFITYFNKRENKNIWPKAIATKLLAKKPDVAKTCA